MQIQLEFCGTMTVPWIILYSFFSSDIHDNISISIYHYAFMFSVLIMSTMPYTYLYLYFLILIQAAYFTSTHINIYVSMKSPTSI